MLVAPLVMRAQVTAGQPSAAVARASRFDSALASARMGNVAAAEAVLLEDNLRPANTLAGEIESATKLAHLALALRQSADYPASNLAVQRALARLTDAAARQAAASAADRAQASETAGFIHETLLFDLAAAKAAYQQAQSLYPGSKAAGAGLARIQAAEQMKRRALGERS